MENCVFCKIIKKEISSSIVYEDEKTFAFLDISPASLEGGHTLVMPKNHYKFVSEMSDEDSKAIALTIKKLSKALLKFGEGMNIIQNNNKIAGQYVPHVHFHLIPRFKGDGITIEKWSSHKYKDNRAMEEIANKIKSLLKD
ncbi:HIT family protein [Candidatus Woesearchaeota archaeon]|nr:HIT family protein [Candidatus Woesearchaeota archaeon]